MEKEPKLALASRNCLNWRNQKAQVCHSL